jgi:transcriptional antiterminator NusG
MTTEVNGKMLRNDPHGEGDWYVVHTNSSMEHNVKKNLEHRIQTMGMQDQIFDILVPMEPESEDGGKKRSKNARKVFPGYILVNMLLNDRSWAVVRNTPGVTGFVGLGRKPTPLQDKEVESIRYQMGLHETRPVSHVTFRVGQSVRITDGPFSEFIGLVDKVYGDKKRLRVMVHIFGRETAVELGFVEVEEA